MQELALVIEQIKKAVALRGVSPNKAFIESGIGKDFIANMLKGMTPAAYKFSDLADYLDCSVDYLLGRTDKPEVNR